MGGQGSNDRIITLAELRRHAEVKDAWIAVAGGVYDITEFIASHPGMNGAGAATSTVVAIMNALGKDCTDDFTAIHSQTAWNQLEAYRIGRIESHDAGGCEPWTGYDDAQVRATVWHNVESQFARHVRQATSYDSSVSTASSDRSSDFAIEGTEAIQSKLRPISLKELSVHSAVDSAWVAADGFVYDVTALLQSGGLGCMAANMLNLGADCTHIFNYIPALQSPELQECIIGTLDP